LIDLSQIRSALIANLCNWGIGNGEWGMGNGHWALGIGH